MPDHEWKGTAKRVVIARNAAGERFVIGSTYSQESAEKKIRERELEVHGLVVEEITALYSWAEFEPDLVR